MCENFDKINFRRGKMERRTLDQSNTEVKKCIIEDSCVKKIIEFYKEEFKHNLTVALKPFTYDLSTPLQIVMNFGEE